ncbi:MAG: DUF1592 domain-containing protein [Bryobacterales bacterium]|nr:DUF1592 domain-containing protein [Bryobacterales bacterium]
MSRASFVCILGLSPLWAADSAAVFQFVEKSCVQCHNSKVKSGDVDLKTLTANPKTFEDDREVWEKVAEKLQTKQMPPPGLPQPPAEVSAATLAWLRDEFTRQDQRIKPEPGRVSARRLNRTEYNNTIRDLLGVDLRPADNFPADTAAFGFDNISDALSLSPALLENYLNAAERSLRTALYGPEQRKPANLHYSAPVRINLARGQSIVPKDLSNYDLTGLSTLHSFHVTHRFPVDAEYNFRLTLNGHRPNQSEPAHPALFIDGKLVKEFEIDATDLEGQIVEHRTRVVAGEHLISASYLRNYHGLPPSYNGPEPSKRPPEALITVRGKLTDKDIETLRKYGTRIKTDAIETRVDNRYESIDLGGPFNQTTGASPESLKRIYTCGHLTGNHSEASCPRTIIRSFAGRAFRRPATQQEVDQYLRYYTLARKQGDSLTEGLVTALQAVLVSPKFLYRIEKDRPTAGPAPLDSYELASRLSYFLWSSMPDMELLQLAGKGALTDPAVRRRQVARMLRERKSFALVENFAGQWLQFRNIDVVRPDLGKFPYFDDGLRYSMRRETELFLDDLIRSDASVLTLLDAKHSYLNERLARFYGIPGVTGPEFRRVDMSATTRGGGVLAHASLLTVTSYSTRTSPVLRGKWILETLLNAPPPAPPPGVPPLEEAKGGKGGTLRQQMEEHRKNPACASCHSRMDPLGFGLENFDAIGSWRTKDGDLALDSSGALPDGRSFESPNQLKEILSQDRHEFVQGLAEKLLTYALGRGLERYDRPAVTKIVADVESNGYRFSQLVTSIVESLPFRMRNGISENKQLAKSTGEQRPR